MCVGFQKTVVISDQSEPTETKVSKKGRDPFWLVVSVVNCMWALLEIKGG